MPFFVDLPILHIDSMFLGEKPFSSLKMSNVAGAPIPVMSLEDMTKSSEGFTPSEYTLSSAFCQRNNQLMIANQQLQLNNKIASFPVNVFIEAII